MTERWIRDLPVFGADKWLKMWRCRVWCARCGGPKLEQVSWLAPYARVTTRLAESVALLSQKLALKHEAEYFALSWDQVKAIDKAYLERTLGPVDLDGLEAIAMDEFAIQKGHRYATVVIDPTTTRVLWVARGRGRVAMDMNASYELEVALHCPQAEVIYDLFHVVAKYAREVIDRVRVDEANRLRNDPKARKVIKGSRRLLLRNKENIQRPEDRVRLRELLDANKKLMTVYLLKDDLKQLWKYRYSGAALRFWKSWYGRAVRSRIKPLVAFAKKLEPYLAGIITHCRWPLHTSVIEGVSNKIKSHQTNGIRLQRRRLLLPQNQSSVPRKNRMNLKKHPV